MMHEEETLTPEPEERTSKTYRKDIYAHSGGR